MGQIPCPLINPFRKGHSPIPTLSAHGLNFHIMLDKSNHQAHTHTYLTHSVTSIKGHVKMKLMEVQTPNRKLLDHCQLHYTVRCNNQGCHENKMATPFNIPYYMLHSYFSARTYTSGFIKTYLSFSNADKGSQAFSVYKMHQSSRNCQVIKSQCNMHTNI